MKHSISSVPISSPGISETANLGAHKEARIRSPPPQCRAHRLLKGIKNRKSQLHLGGKNKDEVSGICITEILYNQKNNQI